MDRSRGVTFEQAAPILPTPRKINVTHPSLETFKKQVLFEHYSGSMVVTTLPFLRTFVVQVQVYLRSRLIMVGSVGFGVSDLCGFARQGQSESDVFISMRCVNSMSDDILVY